MSTNLDDACAQSSSSSSPHAAAHSPRLSSRLAAADVNGGDLATDDVVLATVKTASRSTHLLSIAQRCSAEPLSLILSCLGVPSRDWAAAAATCRRWADAARLPSAVPPAELETITRAVCKAALWTATGYGLQGSNTVQLRGTLCLDHNYDSVSLPLPPLSPAAEKIVRQVDTSIYSRDELDCAAEPTLLQRIHQAGRMPRLQMLRIRLYHTLDRWSPDLAAALRTAWTARAPANLHTLWIEVWSYLYDWTALLPLLPQLRVLAITRLPRPLWLLSLRHLETLVLVWPGPKEAEDMCVLMATARWLSVHGALRTLRLASELQVARMPAEALALLVADRWPRGLLSSEEERRLPLLNLPPAQLTDLQILPVASDASLHAVLLLPNLRRLVYPLPDPQQDGNSEVSLTGFLAESAEEIAAACERSDSQERAIAESARDTYARRQREAEESAAAEPAPWTDYCCDVCERCFTEDDAWRYVCTSCGAEYQLCEACFGLRRDQPADVAAVAPRPTGDAHTWSGPHDPRHVLTRVTQEQWAHEAATPSCHGPSRPYPGAACEENWGSRMVPRPTASQVRQTFARLENLTMGGTFTGKRPGLLTPQGGPHLQRLLIACANLRVLQLHAQSLHRLEDDAAALAILCNSVAGSLEELVLDGIAPPDERSWEAIGRLSRLRTLEVIPQKRIPTPTTSSLLHFARLPHFQHLTIDFGFREQRLDLNDSVLLQAIAQSPAWCCGSLYLRYELTDSFEDRQIIDPAQVAPDCQKALIDSHAPPKTDRVFDRLTSFRFLLGESKEWCVADLCFAVRRGADGEWRWTSLSPTSPVQSGPTMR